MSQAFIRSFCDTRHGAREPSPMLGGGKEVAGNEASDADLLTYYERSKEHCHPLEF